MEQKENNYSRYNLTKFFGSDEGLTLKTSVLETLHIGQFTLSTYLTDAKLSCSTPSPPPLTQPKPKFL